MAALHASRDAATGEACGVGFETLPVAMAMLDSELAILEANTAFAALLDVPAASLVGEPLAQRLRSAASDVPPGDGVQTYGFQCADGPRWLCLDLLPQGEK